MKKKYWVILLVVFSIMNLTLFSCSKDNDDVENGIDSGFTINNNSVDKILSAVCEEQHLQEENWVSFGANFLYEGSITPLEIGVPFKSFSQLKAGQELIEYVDFISYNYYEKSYEAEGSMKVKNITNSSITLQFTNFSFIISYGSQRGKEYLINGSITYDFN